ncbi:Dienelactone hydrolase [Metarhizium rileyi]|uniref:Dienelactone hydrolase n=1 Tax=Metarhizium rileyi (strain RCEF 4871) TaxID=1649241 RepID=A0A162LU88_METRR|nr:Dienelactone hydrolase [Metarhizium rileyi RCEF 4871]
MTIVDGKYDAYISEPPQTTTTTHKECGLLYLPDAFGIWQNSKLMADDFAAQGYTCVVLDIYNRDPLRLNSFRNIDIPTWLSQGSSGDNPHTFEFVDPIVIAGIQKMRDLGFVRIGAVGYCFGARYVVRHFASGISCGCIAHPYSLEQEELSAVSGPLCVIAAENDTAFTMEKRYRAEEALRRSKRPFQITVFSGVDHGFAARANPKIKTQCYAKDEAFRQAVAWFDCYLEEPTESAVAKV